MNSLELQLEAAQRVEGLVTTSTIQLQSQYLYLSE